MAQKKIIEQQPTYSDRSQYNFDDDYSGDFIHDDSIGIPKENETFIVLTLRSLVESSW